MKLAVINKEKCRPDLCGHECKKKCPVEKKEADSCVVIDSKSRIDENTCIGCGICVRVCPFGAIDIINLPSFSEKDIVHRYGENGFALYGLPVPRKGSILGLLGRNGIGKSTAVRILSGNEMLNLGRKESSEEEIKRHFSGNEILRYFEELKKSKIAYKPQNLSNLVVNVKVIDLLRKRGKESEIKKFAERLGVSHTLNNEMNKLSGGELQKIAIIAASLGDPDIYFYDEPLAYLDISERLRVSDFIKEIGKDKTVIVVEHDLLILDYLVEYLNIFYGNQGSYGAVSGIKTSKYGVNSYLDGFLKEENMRIRDKSITFNFTKNPSLSGVKIAQWPAFNLKFDSGFKLHVSSGEVRRNQVIGILGRNGTGKTSFVRALAGDIETNIGNLNLDLKISYKSQYLFTDSEEIVRDVIFKDKISSKLKSVFNLGILATKKLKDLSGGELQRLFIARCLSKEADIYLIDEPSAYLDVEERISVARAIKDFVTENEKTSFVVDHDLLLISYLADSIINFEGESGIKGKSSEVRNFEKGISELLKSLDITLRKDEDIGRPKINSRNSVKDREQKSRGEWAIF